MKACKILIILTLLVLASCSQPGDIYYSNSHFELSLNGATGSIRSLVTNGVDLIRRDSPDEPLFTIRLRSQDNQGAIREINALQAQKCRIKVRKEIITMNYSQFGEADITVTVTVRLDKKSPFSRWNLSISNNTDLTIDHIDFPNVVVPNDLAGKGGTGRIFWPAQEGCLVEDLRIREESPWLKYKPIEYPQMGWGGLYPASTQMQYMAYYNSDAGLYLAAHDASCNPKGIEFRRADRDGIRLEFRLFPGAPGKGFYKMPYDMVIGVFKGDWYDASAIYRDWRDSSKMIVPPKIKKNTMLPEWYTESPVVATWPVRGHRDLGDMTPNELYPYTNGLKWTGRYSEAFDSRILALLMHWEGSAPWAPPYAWPPYGSEKNYIEFVNGLHDQGNLAGLYASGTGYTLRSNTDTSYNNYIEYEEKHLEKVMKVAPDGTLATNGVCAGPDAQRIGYDMCPSNDFVKEVVKKQIADIVGSKTDYIQYFDQNLGGSCYPCYGTSHGHPFGPGIWMNEAMHDLFTSFQPVLENAGYKPLVGCEAAASEANMPFLFFNDARATINLFVGTPVPAYAFVNHEYVNNFMGNQNAVSVAIDVNKCPYNYLQRLAYAFCAGDMLTVILRGNGDMIWDWGTAWENDIPDQKQIITLVRNLNGWRQKAGKEFLVYGRMLKPIPFEGAVNIPMITKQEARNINFPSVFTSNWETAEGGKAQFFVNYLPEEQTITFDIKGLHDVKVFEEPSSKEGERLSDSTVTRKIKPLSAIMVSYSK